MNEDERLRSILREWGAPDPPPGLDRRVRDGFRARFRQPRWRTVWRARISIPIPAMAGILLLAAGLFWYGTRPAQPAPPPAGIEPAGYVTEVRAAGFRPLPDGTARVIRAGEAGQ